jgi:hypothetical protein
VDAAGPERRIATNGQIVFVGEGMDALQVSGTSLGLYDGEEAPLPSVALARSGS